MNVWFYFRMNIGKLTQLLAVIGAGINFVLVFLNADPGTLKGVGFLLCAFLGGVCAAPYLFALRYRKIDHRVDISSFIMLTAVIVSIGFSIFIFWTFMNASGRDKDPLIIVIIPIYLGIGLGLVASLASFLSARRKP